jgi:hypothetical protein
MVVYNQTQRATDRSLIYLPKVFPRNHNSNLPASRAQSQKELIIYIILVCGILQTQEELTKYPGFTQNFQEIDTIFEN